MQCAFSTPNSNIFSGSRPGFPVIAATVPAKHSVIFSVHIFVRKQCFSTLVAKNSCGHCQITKDYEILTRLDKF